MCGFMLNASHCDAPDDQPVVQEYHSSDDTMTEVVDIKKFSGVEK